MMDDCCGAVVFNNEQWEAAEAQYALLDLMLQAEVDVVEKEAAVGGAGGAPLVAQLLVLLDSGDDRERECLSEMLGMMWAEGLFRDALISKLHNALWAFVFDDRGKPWCRGPQFVYRLLQVLCSCLDEGGLDGLPTVSHQGSTGISGQLLGRPAHATRLAWATPGAKKATSC